MNSTEQLLCGNCDNPIEEHFNYCPNCGEKINMEVENESNNTMAAVGDIICLRS